MQAKLTLGYTKGRKRAVKPVKRPAREIVRWQARPRTLVYIVPVHHENPCLSEKNKVSLMRIL
jgi:hypothetical protein